MEFLKLSAKTQSLKDKADESNYSKNSTNCS